MTETVANSAAFDQMLEAILESAYRVALRTTRNADDAADLLQDAVVRALQARDSFEVGTNFRAWFFTIMTRLWWRKSSRQKVEVQFEVNDDPELYLFRECKKAGMHPETVDPARALVAKLDAERVMSAIDELSDDYRIATALHLVEGLSYQEIAESLECPIGTVRSRIHRGRNLLQRRLWSLYNEDQ